MQSAWLLCIYEPAVIRKQKFMETILTDTKNPREQTAFPCYFSAVCGMMIL